MNIPRDTPLKKAIYACDELVGFIGACVKVRPSKKIADLPGRVGGEEAQGQGVRALGRPLATSTAAPRRSGRPLDEHVGFLIEALKPIADEIGL